MAIYKRKHSDFVQVAIDEANKSLMSQKHGCVIVHNNKIVSKGHNYRIFKDNKSHIKYSIHAEESAILKLKCKPIDNLHMYVVRVRDNEVMLSQPCDKCKAFINSLNINKIFYTEMNDV